ncbi:MAG: hypothetical protein EOP86_01375 [Verrucomicrobiaceae bacterium]|nr:MAG: hypothetical protein EOP86_01375 [Verrucomicrobiaceae bacterium]
MKSERLWPLLRISLAGMNSRGSCWLLLGGAIIFAWLAPLVTPWEENPVILQPARAQAAWMYAWIALLTWLPFQAAALAKRFRSEGMLEHLRAGGYPAGSLFLQLAGAVMVWMLAIGLLAVIVTVGFCRPGQPDEAALWAGLTLQYFALYSLSAAPLLLLGIALGTRVSEVVAFMVPVCVLFAGLFGGSVLAPVLADSQSPVLKAVWVALPHYHLADLTPRLVFKMGPLPAGDFLQTACCLGLQGLALALLGLCVFRTRS